MSRILLWKQARALAVLKLVHPGYQEVAKCWKFIAAFDYAKKSKEFMLFSPIWKLYSLIRIYFGGLFIQSNLRVRLPTPVVQVIHLDCSALSWNRFTNSVGSEISLPEHGRESACFWRHPQKLALLSAFPAPYSPGLPFPLTKHALGYSMPSWNALSFYPEKARVCFHLWLRFYEKKKH